MVILSSRAASLSKQQMGKKCIFLSFGLTGEYGSDSIVFLQVMISYANLILSVAVAQNSGIVFDNTFSLINNPSRDSLGSSYMVYPESHYCSPLNH